MKNYTLSKEDLNVLEKIKQVSLSIETLYNNLSDLEINYKKDTEEYSKNFEYLKMCLENENKYYKSLNLDYEKSINLSRFLLDEEFSYEVSSPFESIVMQEYKDRYLRRIVGFLLYKIRNLMKKEKFENENLFTQKIFNSLGFTDSINKDITNLYLMFLQENINNTYSNLRVELIKSKYNCIYIDKSLEQDIIFNNFDINDSLLLESYRTYKLSKIKFISYQTFMDQYFRGFIKDLKDIINEFYEQSGQILNAASLIFIQCFINSGLVFMSRKEVLKLKNDLESDFEYLDCYKINKAMFNECFENLEKNKQKIRKF